MEWEVIYSFYQNERYHLLFILLDILHPRNPFDLTCVNTTGYKQNYHFQRLEFKLYFFLEYKINFVGLWLQHFWHISILYFANGVVNISRKNWELMKCSEFSLLELIKKGSPDIHLFFIPDQRLWLVGIWDRRIVPLGFILKKTPQITALLHCSYFHIQPSSFSFNSTGFTTCFADIW